MASLKKLMMVLLVPALIIFVSAIVIGDENEDSLSAPIDSMEYLTNDDGIVVEEDSLSSDDVESQKLQLLVAASLGDLTAMENVVRSVCNDLIGCPSMATLLREGDTFGNTALHLAVTSGSAEAVKFLLKYGVQKDTYEDSYNIPLNMACIAGQAAIVEKFAIPLKKQTVNLRNSLGNTALTVAAGAGYLDVVKILAPYSDTDSLGDCIVTAVEKGHINVAKAVMESGVCLEQKKLLRALTLIWGELRSHLDFLFVYMTFLLK